jgi:transcriptional regulator with XRE-family HTH domain
MIEIKIAKKIRQRRLEQRMTQEMLANKTGFSKAFISKIENHNTSPSIASLSKIAIALDVSISTLLDENTRKSGHYFSEERDRKKL